MFDKQAVLRIREGAYTYLLATNRAVSIERRSADTFETLSGGSTQVAWYFSSGNRTGGHRGHDRVPVYRLGLLFKDQLEEWAHAIVLDDGVKRMCVAAELVHLIPDHDKPRIQPFNPIGSTIPGPSVIVGLCPDTEPEYLVLDAPRLQSSLRRGGPC